MVETGGAILAGRAPRHWRRVLVSVGLGVVVLAVVGMHQLSLGHLFVTSAGPAGGGHAHGSSSHLTMAAHDDHLAAPTSTAGLPTTDHGGSAVAVGGRVSSAEDGCAGCSDHAMGSGTCLLALTLLVLSWWLRLPRPRSLPPLRRTPRLAGALPRRRPRIRALSLVELSVLRT